MSDKQNDDGTYDAGHHPNSKDTRFKTGHDVIGGRPKGSKNRKTLREELAAKGGLSPAELLYSVMNDENANMGQRMKAAEQLMKYTEQSLTSVEVSGKVDQETVFNFNVLLGGETDTCESCGETACVCETEAV